MGLKFLITKKSGEIGGFKSVGRKSGEGVKNRENPDKIGRVDRYDASLFLTQHVESVEMKILIRDPPKIILYHFK